MKHADFAFWRALPNLKKTFHFKLFLQSEICQMCSIRKLKGVKCKPCNIELLGQRELIKCKHRYNRARKTRMLESDDVLRIQNS